MTEGEGKVREGAASPHPPYTPQAQGEDALRVRERCGIWTHLSRAVADAARPKVSRNEQKLCERET
jgi:hypothetical protein